MARNLALKDYDNNTISFKLIPPARKGFPQDFIDKWKNKQVGIFCIKSWSYEQEGYQKQIVNMAMALELIPKCDVIVSIGYEDTPSDCMSDEIVEALLNGNSSSFVAYDELERHNAIIPVNWFSHEKNTDFRASFGVFSKIYAKYTGPYSAIPRYAALAAWSGTATRATTKLTEFGISHGMGDLGKDDKKRNYISMFSIGRIGETSGDFNSIIQSESAGITFCDDNECDFLSHPIFGTGGSGHGMERFPSYNPSNGDSKSVRNKFREYISEGSSLTATPLVVPTKKMEDVIESINNTITSAESIMKIWKHALRKLPLFLHMDDKRNASMPYTLGTQVARVTDKMENDDDYDSDTMQAIGELLGIDVMIDMFMDGTPLEDIIA